MARSARLRLTLLYSAMFLVLGTAIIVVVFLVGSHAALISTTQVAAVPQTTQGGPIVRVVSSQQHSADVSALFAASWATLVITAIASAVLGWFLAGRVLRPLRQMTSAARTISAGNLHERLGLTGPPDEFKQLGDSFDDLLARLEASFAAQRRFVANAAHELRTPLTVERTLLQVALADPDATAATLRATCEELLESGREHERLLEALLMLASSESGIERREPLDLASLAGQVLLAATPQIEQRALDLTTALEPAPVTGDPALLVRLIANLVDNAVRYNDDRGHAEVRTGGDARGSWVSVRNTGPVIAPEELERLFEPFQRLGYVRTAAAYGHHGLGLSIVRAIAAAHGAAVVAEPVAGGGLAVTVRFEPGGAFEHGVG